MTETQAAPEPLGDIDLAIDAFEPMVATRLTTPANLTEKGTPE